jgi:hypothetical protein
LKQSRVLKVLFIEKNLELKSLYPVKCVLLSFKSEIARGKLLIKWTLHKIKFGCIAKYENKRMSLVL